MTSSLVHDEVQDGSSAICRLYYAQPTRSISSHEASHASEVAVEFDQNKEIASNEGCSTTNITNVDVARRKGTDLLASPPPSSDWRQVAAMTSKDDPRNVSGY